MHLLFQLLFAVMLIATIASLAADHAQRKCMLRLKDLVAVDILEAAGLPDAGGPSFVAGFLSPALARNIGKAGFQPRQHDVAIVIAISLTAALAAALLAGPAAAVGMIAMLLLTGMAALNILASRRAAKLGLLIPGFLDRMRQMLTIGNSLPSAFARTVHGSQPALAKFFAPTLRRIQNGASFCESIRQSADDLDLYEMHLFATAVATNTRFGGSLAHALTNLVAYLRKRGAIDRELRSSTAQIRASAWVLGLLPMLVAAAIVMQNRDYANWFITHAMGKKLLIYCLISQLVGAFLMRAIVKAKF
jgi:tight adherence protein B